MESFGLENFVFDYTKNDVRVLVPTIESVYSEREAISKRISASLPGVQASSYSQFEYVFNNLEL